MQGEAAEIDGAIAELGRLTDLMQRRRARLARGVGITVQQWRVLEQVHSEHFLPSLFARQRECTPAAVSKTLRQLLEKGLIRAAICPEDGRQRRYELTATGRRIVARLRSDRRRAIRAIWSDLPGREVTRFARFAAELSDRLERFSDQPSRKEP
jgi:DNA-binding MarR family transcriptional regulator